VDSPEFDGYIRQLLDNAKNNTKKSHICLSCWALISKSGVLKHKKAAH
jgi:hypothetical protein